jgi:GH24 family phage-related lysozyme (muramidase)
MNLEAIKLCTDVLLHPFEGYHKKLLNGDCESYPDPASPLGRGAISKAQAVTMTPDELLKAGHPWTIGWGTTGPDIVPGLVWTRQQADERFETLLSKFVAGALGLSPDLINEPPRRLAAIISFCYNCGLGNYRISTLRKRVNQGDWQGAYEEIQKWNKAQGIVLNGLTRRRLAEGKFLL